MPIDEIQAAQPSVIANGLAVHKKAVWGLLFPVFEDKNEQAE